MTILIVFGILVVKKVVFIVSNQVEKLRRELEAASEALEQGRQELSSFAEQV